MERISVGVRELIHYTCRAGSLSGMSFADGVSGQVGTRTHHAFFKKLREYFPGATGQTEVPYQMEWSNDEVGLNIRGRADILLKANEGFLQITDGEVFLPGEVNECVIEVKTVASPLAEITGTNRLHRLQCQFYSFMHATGRMAAKAGQPSGAGSAADPSGRGQRRRPVDPLITWGLAYVSAETLETRFFFQQNRLSELRRVVENVCALYSHWALSKQNALTLRNATAKTFSFPYPNLREGQKQMMHAVLGSINEKGTAMIEAPTGLGKTMSTLYPAVKALGNGRCDRVFYLTAKTSVRAVAAKAIDDMRASGLVIKSITMTAREKICFCPDICCEPALCEFADGYYDRLPAALDQLLRLQAFDREVIEKAARDNRLCPFELSLDLCDWCDIIIGDYNHGFDPRASLRAINDRDEHHVLLIDEAHNLPDRARAMFSATLSRKTVEACREALKKLDPEAEKIIASVARYFDQLTTAIDAGRPAFDEVEKKISPADIMVAPDYRGLRCRAPGLCFRLYQFTIACRPILDSIEDFELKRPIRDLFFEAQFFMRICDEFWDGSYILSMRKAEGDYLLEQGCLDVSRHLDHGDDRAQSRIFFSATLTPLTYYAATLCGKDPDHRPETLALPTPFDPARLNLCIYPLETTFRARRQTAFQLAEVIAGTIRSRRVNILVYFPSYQYLNMVYPLVREELHGHPCQLILQRRQMDDAKREKFIRKFMKVDPERPVIGFAVLGGIFGEGIDLVGERLGGVICVGTGLPQVSPQTEILRQYYDEKGENGYLFSYIYPGFNKILQASGRLIRTENDAGFVLLIDERYQRPEYDEMFPRWWHPHRAENWRHLLELLDETVEVTPVEDPPGDGQLEDATPGSAPPFDLGMVADPSTLYATGLIQDDELHQQD